MKLIPFDFLLVFIGGVGTLLLLIRIAYLSMFDKYETRAKSKKLIFNLISYIVIAFVFHFLYVTFFNNCPK